MNDNFFNLSNEEKLALIRKAAAQLLVSDIVIEKDIWVCWILEKLFELPIQMAFKGGTSLSKVFNLIKRFSEDCDVTIDYRNFSKELRLENLNKSQLKKISEQLKEKLQIYISKTVLPHLKELISKEFDEDLFEITLSEDGEQLKFYYPTLIGKADGYVRDHVLIEFGVRNSTEPFEKLSISTYLEQVTESKIKLPAPNIPTLSPLRTFWEKATLIHVECHRDRFSHSPERLSRHWYDLFMLNNSWVGEKALSNKDILQNVVMHKKAFFNAAYANYDDCLTGKFRLIPKDKYLKDLEKDFKKMVEAEMFYEEPPTFKNIAEGLKHLEITINKT